MPRLCRDMPNDDTLAIGRGQNVLFSFGKTRGVGRGAQLLRNRKNIRPLREKQDGKSNEMKERAAKALRAPQVQEWDTWPFEGDVRPKALAPLTPEPGMKTITGPEADALVRLGSRTITLVRLSILASPSVAVFVFAGV